MKKILKWTGLGILALVVVAAILFFVYLYPFMQKMKETTVLPYDQDLTLVIGGGGNSGILSSDSLVIVIDSKMDKAADELYQMAKDIAGKRPILVINTHIHPDHVSGNNLYKGCRIIAGANYSKAKWIKDAGENNLPTQWLKDSLEIKMGDEVVHVYNMDKNIHSESDVLVYLSSRRILFAGDLVLNKQAPVIMGVASPAAYLETFEYLKNKFDLKVLVPGHGSIGDKEIINVFKQYFLDMKEASVNSDKKSELISKYSDWNQVPFLMSPGATVSAFQKFQH
jgi:glyoxylase-like metal-dependent hydrolase (beta-lactamase superfamily II)